MRPFISNKQVCLQGYHYLRPEEVLDAREQELTVVPLKQSGITAF
jgi:hypothetical protein